MSRIGSVPQYVRRLNWAIGGSSKLSALLEESAQALQRGNAAAALAGAEAAAQLASSLPSGSAGPQPEPLALAAQGLAHVAAGNYLAARTCFMEAREQADGRGCQSPGLARLYSNAACAAMREGVAAARRGQALLLSGRHRSAHAAFTQALRHDLSRQTERGLSHLVVAQVLVLRSTAALALGKAGKALLDADRALLLLRNEPLREEGEQLQPLAERAQQRAREALEEGGRGRSEEGGASEGEEEDGDGALAA